MSEKAGWALGNAKGLIFSPSLGYNFLYGDIRRAHLYFLRPLCYYGFKTSAIKIICHVLTIVAKNYGFSKKNKKRHFWTDIPNTYYTIIAPPKYLERHFVFKNGVFITAATNLTENNKALLI